MYVCVLQNTSLLIDDAMSHVTCVQWSDMLHNILKKKCCSIYKR